MLLRNSVTQDCGRFVFGSIFLRDMASILLGEARNSFWHHQLISEPCQNQGLQPVYTDPWDPLADRCTFLFGVGAIIGPARA
ncbi:MAG: hypothetical protein ABNH38_06795 [Tateyamaria sp.]|nr:hypothetical protein [Sulfitobacter sp. M22]